MIFNRSLSKSKSPKVFRFLFSILADLNNAIVWMVSPHPLISKSTCPCTNPLVTLLNTLVRVVNTITFLFHSLFQFFSKVFVLASLFVFLQFYSLISRKDKVHYSASSLFLLTIIKSGRRAEIRWSVCIQKSFPHQKKNDVVSHFLGQSLGEALSVCFYCQI